MHTVPVRATSCFLVLAALAAPARAQRLGYLRASDPTGLAIAREDVDVTCRPAETTEVRCAVEARWDLRNDGESPRSPDLLLSWTGEAENVEVRVAEAVLARHVPTSRSVRVLVPAGGSVRVVLRAEQAAMRYEGHRPGGVGASPLPAIDALSARHPLLAQGWRIERRGIVWARPSPVHWTSVGPTTMRIRAPSDWDVSVHAERPLDDRAQDGARVLVWTPGEADATSPEVVGVELARGVHAEPIRHGGPFLAVGGTVDRGFWGRLGYEIGLGEWFLLSVAADTDFESSVILAPLLEVASYGLAIVPSFSFGVGLPVQIWQQAPLAGLRLEASATFYAFAFVASVDYFPDVGMGRDAAHVRLLARVGL